MQFSYEIQNPCLDSFTAVYERTFYFRIFYHRCPLRLPQHQNLCAWIHISFKRKDLVFFFFFLTLNTNVRIYLEIWEKNKTRHKGRIPLRKPKYSQVKHLGSLMKLWLIWALKELLSGTNKPPSCLPLPLNPIGPSKESENKQGIH